MKIIKLNNVKKKSLKSIPYTYFPATCNDEIRLGFACFKIDGLNCSYNVLLSINILCEIDSRNAKLFEP